MIRLTASRTQELLSQPENGMGYQIVEVTNFAGRIEKGVAYNAELVVLQSDPPSYREAKITKSTYPGLLNLAESSAGEIRSIRVLKGERAISLSYRESVQKSAAAKPAKDAPKEKTKENEVFKRFSAYDKDNRRTADDGWLPGTYATTEKDAENVKTGSDAVARYALPNKAPASYVYTCKPKKDTTIQYGTVEPANDQPGGGVEVLFADGTNPGSVSGPEKIPD